MRARDKTKLLLARQLAIQQEQIWEKLAPRARERLLTFAGTLLATVERKASVNWKEPQDDRKD